MHLILQQRALRVDEQMALAPLNLLAGVEAAGSTSFRRLD
jgi:hypothetical protein